MEKNMEKNMEATIMGYIGFRVFSLESRRFSE